MSSTRLVALCIDANDPHALARFWGAALGAEVVDNPTDELHLAPTEAVPFHILFLPVTEPKSGKNRIHFDLVAESLAHQAEMVDLLTSHGARPAEVGQEPDADHVVLADPEGNEFCIVLRGEFLASTGVLGAIVFEPAAHAMGFFWSEAAGWPVVYDEDGDTAIRSPDGTGPFITFGPPVSAAKAGKNRIHLDVAPFAGDTTDRSVERLVARGAQRVDIGQGDDVTWTVLADPEGNEFCVLAPR